MFERSNKYVYIPILFNPLPADTTIVVFNPLTAGAAYIRVFIFY